MFTDNRFVQPSAVAASLLLSTAIAAGQMAYVSGKGCEVPLGDGHLWQLDLQTGSMTNLGEIGNCSIEGLAIGRDGRIYAHTEVNADPLKVFPEYGLWDFTTRPGFKIGGDGLRPGVDSGLAFDPTSGRLYSLNGADFLFGINWSWLYELDPITGEATLVGEDRGIYVDSLAINSKGEAFAADMVFNQNLFSVDLTTGDLEWIAKIVGGDVGNQCALAFDAEDNLWMISPGHAFLHGRTVKVDTTTGETSHVAWIDPIRPTSQGASYSNLAIIVPESCYADCDQSTGAGVLDVFDFLCFQSSFVAGEPYACECDTSTGAAVCDIFDFLCFQSAFVNGCP